MWFEVREGFTKKNSCSFLFCPNYLSTSLQFGQFVPLTCTSPPPSFQQNPKEQLLFFVKPSLSCNNEPKICLSLWLRRKQLYHWFLGTSPTGAVITISLDAPKVLPSESLRQRKFWPLRSAANILHTCKGGNNGDDIKLCHWFPKFPFLSLLSNLI